MEKPFVNSWTEFGDLEYICVGRASGMHYPEKEPFYMYNVLQDKWYDEYIVQPVGPRPLSRIRKAEQELAYFKELLEAEMVTVATLTEFEADIKEDLKRKRSFIETPKNVKEDKRVHKKKVDVVLAPKVKLNELILTPWFKSYYQFGLACPRDMITTLGNTILEAATCSRARYFESNHYRSIFYKFYDGDKRIHWKTAPQPTCQDSMFRYYYQDKPKSETKNGRNVYETALNEKEVAFDAADLIRCGKDVFYKRSASANAKGLDWLRREFKDLRFHMMHFKGDLSPHIDVDMIPMRPPTAGSEGIVLVNQIYRPLKSQMKLFTDNNWKPVFAPKPVVDKVSPVAVCSENLNMNFLCLNTKCIIMEECEVPLYHLLEDLGYDVITCPLRSLNEFGGGPHCVTWDIRRDDSCKDYFPNQNYEEECKIDYIAFNDTKWL